MDVAVVVQAHLQPLYSGPWGRAPSEERRKPIRKQNTPHPNETRMPTIPAKPTLAKMADGFRVARKAYTTTLAGMIAASRHAAPANRGNKRLLAVTRFISALAIDKPTWSDRHHHNLEAPRLQTYHAD